MKYVEYHQNLKKLVLINFLEKYYVKNIGNNLEDLGNLKTLIQEEYLMIMKLD